MLRYAGKLTLTPGEMNENDVNRLREAGFSDEAIGDMAITISMYAYMNRIVDGIGGSLPKGMDREAARLGLGRFAAETTPAGDGD